MKLAFLFAPYRHKRFEENIYVVDEDFGIFPPINLAYAAAIAERAGHDVRLFDANALIRKGKATQQQVVDDVVAFRPDAIGLYFSTYMFRDTLAWAQLLKERTGCPVIAGGINCTIYPEETLAQEAIDAIAIGHAHESLPHLLSAMEAGRRLDDIEGIGCKVDGRLVVNRPTSTGPVDFESFPLPARHLLQNDLYHSFISQRRNFTIAMTTLGCPYPCNFCAIAPLPRGARSVENVMAEIEEVHGRHDVREIDFFDANFTTPGPRTRALLEALARAPRGMEFSCRARIDNIDRRMARAMKRAGLRQVYLGIESSESDILELLHKKLKPSYVRRALAMLRAEGIRPLGFFMLGSPGESLVTALRTILFSLSLGLDYAQFSRTIAKPHTELYDKLCEMTGTDYWRDYVRGSAEEQRLPSPWTELSEAQIEFLTKLGYLVFYYRPGYVLRTLARMRSYGELSRSARTAARMLMNSIYFD